MLFSLCALAVYYMQIRKLDFLKARCATPICCVFFCTNKWKPLIFVGKITNLCLDETNNLNFSYMKGQKKIAFRLFFFRKILAQKQGMCQYCVAHP